MPIRPDMRWFYPIDWLQLSREIRFSRAGGRCEQCLRPHGKRVTQLTDGRWWDEEASLWRDDQGDPAEWPDMIGYLRAEQKHVVLSAAHLDHDPANSSAANLKALCQRCHLAHDRAEHLKRRRITVLMRRALGDLFAGPYKRW